jgi:hypothetical protein
MPPDDAFRTVLQPMARGHGYRLTVIASGKLPPGRISDRVGLRAGGRTFEVPITGYVDPAY